MRLKRKNAKWEFSIHLDADKGPNRITYDPSEAERFFKRLCKRNPEADDAVVRALHIESNLVWETDNSAELNYFVQNLVNYTGTIRHG